MKKSSYKGPYLVIEGSPLADRGDLWRQGEFYHILDEICVRTKPAPALYLDGGFGPARVLGINRFRFNGPGSLDIVHIITDAFGAYYVALDDERCWHKGAARTLVVDGTRTIGEGFGDLPVLTWEAMLAGSQTISFGDSPKSSA